MPFREKNEKIFPGLIGRDNRTLTTEYAKPFKDDQNRQLSTKSVGFQQVFRFGYNFCLLLVYEGEGPFLRKLLPSVFNKMRKISTSSEIRSSFGRFRWLVNRGL